MPQNQKQTKYGEEETPNLKLKSYAKEMRNKSIIGEIKFWCELLRKKKSGYKFYRQKVIDKYIVDFFCAKLRLVIEIDGTSHEDRKEYDKSRDTMMETLGLKVVRYDDLQVIYNFHLVEKDFEKQVEDRARQMGLV